MTSVIAMRVEEGRGAAPFGLLAEGQDEVCRALVGSGDRFQRVAWAPTGEGAVVIEGASAWFDCAIHQEIEAGDHLVVLLEVRAMRAERSRQPLVFHHSRLRSLAG